MRRRLILDIETAGRDFDTLDEHTREYLLRRAKTDEEIKEVRESLSFYPLTGEVIAIGLLDADTAKGNMYYQTPGIDPLLPFEEDGVRFETGTEADILNKFWNAVKTASTLITFNGRGFDCPFLIVRSAMHKIKPTTELMSNRYGDFHIDLFDRLSFFGSVSRKFSLDMWCRAFNIKSPKAGGITGYEVAGLYKSGRHTDIARYCMGDIRATGELFKYWEKYMQAR